MELEQEKRIDRRVIKTKRAIRNAFAELLTKKEIDQITIKDIADTAEVNRKTIYNYYNGIYEILDEIENEIVSSYETVIKDVDFKVGADTYAIFDRLTKVISRDIDFYGHLLDMNVNSLLERKIVVSLKNRLKEAFIEQQLFPIDKVDIIVDYIGAGMFGVYQGWFLSGRKKSIDEISKDVSMLVLNGVNVFKH